MQKKSKAKKQHQNKIESDNDLILFFTPVLIQIIIYFVICVATYLLDIENKLYYYAFFISTGISSLISGFTIGRKKHKNGMLNGIIYTLPSVFIVIMVSLMINKFSFDYHIIISIVLPIFLSSSGGIAAVNYKKKIKIHSWLLFRGGLWR